MEGCLASATLARMIFVANIFADCYEDILEKVLEVDVMLRGLIVSDVRG